MKLKKIKLSGFKSFVDSTPIQLQSNLTGIVGPNGCGKSNIIDALRWVMGEISAKQLRGDSMSDVIFNGSSARNSVGKATVELVFDNSEAIFGGEYASYGEISIKREVARDGCSDYFLNNTVCRRKDITNIFLGTGLGHNSYAVIEQGTISQFIDAKPDELRVFIEEAAGISRYKERRRETENRIKNTKENLFRLNDIIEEVNKQLKHLKSQASAAERYKKLKEEERLAKAELHLLHWQELAKKLKSQDDLIKEDEAKLEDKLTELHLLSAKIAKLDEQHNLDLEKFNHIQAEYYRIGGNIARFEQQIKYIKEREGELNQDLKVATQNYQDVLSHKEADQGQIELLKSEQQKIATELTKAKDDLTRVIEQLRAAEEQEKQLQRQWDEFNLSSARVEQLLGVEQTHIKHLEQMVREENLDIEKINHELADIDFSLFHQEVAALDEHFNSLKLKREQLQQDVVAKQLQISGRRDEVSLITADLDQAKIQVQTLGGRLSSLEALQQAALGKTDAVLADWLSSQQLADRMRLAQELTVARGWETAVETVLGVFLEAVCVDGMAKVASSVKQLTSGNLIIFDSNFKGESSFRLSLPTLLSKITAPVALGNLLHGVYVADGIDDAFSLQNQLRDDESIITKSGVWLGKNWVRVVYNNNPKLGIIERERELHDLHATLAKEQETCKNLEDNLTAAQGALLALEADYQNLHHELGLVINQYSDAQSQATAKRSQLQHLTDHSLKLNQQLTAHEDNLLKLRQQLDEATSKHSGAILEQSAGNNKRQQLIQRRSEVGQEVSEVRKLLKVAEENNAALVLKSQLMQTQVEHLIQNLSRSEQRLSSLKEQESNLRKNLADNVAPLAELERDLEQDLVKRLSVESELTEAKQKNSGFEQELRDLKQQQVTAQEIIDHFRGELEKMRTERQGLEVRNSTYLEQIAELGLEIEVLKNNLSEAANIKDWEEKISYLGGRIERLGLINLAAIEEYEKLEERKQYLDAQNQDLVGALNTLEEAIRKIDLDTKEKFKGAYEKINQKFQELFPKIFNGGKAYLEQTTNNLLETGVLIMAQPPGKRNTTIHLLSGGEKALTAIALIFSIFHLTPAPFCILDEVDAPLDDLNVTRFCNLVKEMAASIQFIFITHNKLTMEIASQLIGVTMHEPGVSRIVAVDVDEAVSLSGSKK